MLQKPTNDTAYAFPGGHAEFGETNAQTLVREFQEEIGVDISVSDLKWVAEILRWNSTGLQSLNWEILKSTQQMPRNS